LKELETKLRDDFPDLQIEINQEKDALRFKGDGLFQTSSSKLASDKRKIVEKIAMRLNEVLPCYTVGRKSYWTRACNEAGAVIEAVQIEGHTDSDGRDIGNLILSTERANETFIVMTQREPTLVEYLNNRLQPVLSVAGYGRMRPVADNRTNEGKATNRRIDLRIIMYTPQSLEDIQKVRQDLQKGMGLGAPQ
jgi:outer membrane protein OmpA-like peptidoglycan-associated protein